MDVLAVSLAGSLHVPGDIGILLHWELVLLFWDVYFSSLYIVHLVAITLHAAALNDI